MNTIVRWIASSRQRATVNVLAGSLAPLACALFILLIAAEVGLLILVDGRFANDVHSPMWEFLTLFQVLWEQNATQALTLLSQQPLIEIAHVDEETELTLWRMYLYVPTFLAHLMGAIIAVGLLRSVDQRALPHMLTWLMVGVALLVVPTIYVNMVAHCAGPTWLLDAFMRSLRGPLGETSLLWARLPFNVGTLYLVVQWSMASAGLAILSYQMWRQRFTAQQ